MKKRHIEYTLICLVFMVLSILFFNGCDDKPSASGLHNVSHAGTELDDCYERVKLRFSESNQGTRVYWIGIEKNSKILAHGEGIWLTGGFSNVVHYIDVNYTHNLIFGNKYDYYVYACSNKNKVGNIGAASSRAGPIPLQLSSQWNYSDCYKTCCTEGRKYTQLQNDISGLNGLEARIKTRYGKVCSEGVGPDDGFGVVNCSLKKTNQPMWGQIGYGYERYHDWVIQTIYYWYWEVKESGPIPRYRYEDFCCPLLPLEGDVHLYRCELDETNGLWKFFMDDTINWVDTVYSADWFVTAGLAVISGEILNFEDDMAGTFSDKCHITDCRYRISGQGFQNFYLQSNHFVSDDLNEWGIQRVSGNAFNIWDKNPQP